MFLTHLIAVALALSAQPAPEQRELAAPILVESVDYVVLRGIDAGGADRLLQNLFTQLKIRPQCKISVFTLPRETQPRLVFLKGKEADVSLMKKLFTAMEEASGRGLPGVEKPFVMRLESKELTAEEMRVRILKAAERARLPLSEEDIFVFPPGAAGSLFYIGTEDLSPRVAELCKGLDRKEAPRAAERAREYLSQLGEDVTKAFGGLFSTVISAATILLLHAVLCHLPFLGRRYRRSFRLFWEKLFASFRGQDLAWEIIKTAAGIGAAAAPGDVGAQKERGAAGDSSRSESWKERKERATKVASEYIRWRGLDEQSAEVRSLLDAALEASLRMKAQ